MKEEEVLILIDGEDQTKKVSKIETNFDTVKIQFIGKSTVYSYHLDRVVFEWVTNIIDLNQLEVYYKNQLLFDVQKVIVYLNWVKVFFSGGQVKVLEYSFVSFRKISVCNMKDVMQYFKTMVRFTKNNLDPEKDSFLKNEYRKLDYIDHESVLYKYLNGSNITSNIEEPEFVIFPFKFNLSQREAALNVFRGNISVIEGPPGTGKTQTILNILANLAIMQNKSVAVVSNNNEAVNNVREKLEKAGYSFLVADLGRGAKRKKFFENVPQPHVNLPEQFVEREIVEKLNILDQKLNDLFLKNNQKAELIKHIEQYQLEQKYFEEYYQKQDIEEISNLSFYQNSQEILNALNDISFLEDSDVNLKWLKRIQMFFRYGKKRLKDIDTHSISIILDLQRKFYDVKIKELKESCDLLEKKLKKEHFQKLQEEHQQLSLQLFNLKLYERYHGKINIFNEKEYKRGFQKFLNAFPIILSTTYSLRNSIPEHYLLDYVIVDEASQVDLLSGALVLSCAKNVIVVGDEKQLPQIIDNHIKANEKDFFVSLEYDYFKNSLISSILRVYGKTVPKTILKEHYRCHPKIIEFCNQRYYNNELIAFYNEEHLKVDKPLILYYTSLGHHMRIITNGEKKGIYNNRELEVIQEEVLNTLNINCYYSDDIGITTPYRMQADNIDIALEKKIKADTIHKFQGREKKLMILSTVIDNSVDGKKKVHFVDDPCMVNVAVSRAICQFVIVTDHDLFNQDGKEINALLKYIKYNTFDSKIIQSKIVSVFDLLYKDYSPKLNSLGRRLLSYSRYKSENIMDTILNDEFQKEEYVDYIYRRQIKLKNILLDLSFLAEEEKDYVNHGASVDFVVADALDKTPLLFIEVDGFYYHKNNPKQLERDKLKDSIAFKCDIPILRFETDGTRQSEEQIIKKIRKQLLSK